MTLRNCFRKLTSQSDTQKLEKSENPRKGLNVFTGTFFAAGENAGADLFALPAAIAGTGSVGVVVTIWCGINAGYARVALAKSG